MNDLTPTDDAEQPLERDSGQPRCAYCGARLHGAVYFCIGCGTPYKDVSSVLATPLPPVMDEGELIRRKAPSLHALFWSYVGVLIGAFVLGELLFVGDRPELKLALAEFALLILTAVWARLHWRTLWAQLKRSGLKPAAALALLLLVPLLALNFVYHGLITQLQPDAVVDPIGELRDAGISESTIVAVFCVFPAVTEELAFRGLVQHWLMTALKPWRAIALASFLFAIMHFSIVSTPYLFLVGCLLGWSKWKTGSLYPAMVIHFLHNLIVIEFWPPGQ